MQSVRKPLPLIASAGWWAVQTISAFIYATYVNFRVGNSPLGMAILTVLLFLTFALLWFLWAYWQGQDWTRILVISGLVLKVAYQIFSLLQVRHLPRSTMSQALFWIRIGDMIFSAYVLFWLFTKEARSYFRFPQDWGPTKQQSKVAH